MYKVTQDYKRDIYKEHLTGAVVRDEYIQWMQSIDVKFHLTLTFPYGTQERKSVDQLNMLLIKLNTKIFKKRYTANEEHYLKGIAVMEDSPDMDAVHFHVLIEDGPYLPELNRFKDLLEQVLQYFVKDNKWTKYEYQLDEYELRPFESLEAYLTKVFENPGSVQNAQDRIAAIGKGGATFDGLGALSLYGNKYPNAMKRYSASA